MIVVDTNILFPAFIEGVNTERVRQLRALDPDWRIEGMALIEFTNILATYHRQEYLSADDARHCLQLVQAEFLFGTHAVSTDLALDLAIQFQITAYDARHVLLARTLGTRLVTEDRRLRASAPDLTESLDEALARLNVG